MSIILSQKSLGKLEGLHPNLKAIVIDAAAMATEDFTVLEGLRTKEQMYINYGKGRTAAQLNAKGVPARFAEPKAGKVTWLNDPLMSNHRLMPDGWGHAVDLAPWPIDWNDGKRFERLRDLMFLAAKKRGIKIRWGRDWDNDGRYEEKGETDGPHFELV